MQDAGLEPHCNAAAIRSDLAGDDIQVELHVQKVSWQRLGILFSLGGCHYVEDGWNHQPAWIILVILMVVLPRHKTMLTVRVFIINSLS